MTSVPLRIVQWTTGNVGRRSLRAIIRAPHLELVGLYAWSPDKVGVDAGTLAGLDPVGVVATDDIDALIALKPDCVSYTPIWMDVDHLCRLLAAGINVASTAEFITGRHLGEEKLGRLRAAALAGGATMFGTGVNPGFANMFALVSSAICDRVDRISVTESVDASGYASAETQIGVGFAGDPADPALPGKAQAGTAVFADAVALIADTLQVDLDEIGFEAEFAGATEDTDLGFMTIPRGTVAAIRAGWYGVAAGRRIIECRVLWTMAPHDNPAWKVRHGYFVEIDGEPTVRSQFQLLPPPDWDEPDYMGLGMIMTAMPAVNAIPAVCAAEPGIATYRTLPMIAAAGFVTT